MGYMNGLFVVCISGSSCLFVQQTYDRGEVKEDGDRSFWREIRGRFEGIEEV